MRKYRPQFRLPNSEEIETLVCRLKVKHRGKSIAEKDLANFFEEIKEEWAKINLVSLLPLNPDED